jgi:nitrite reductase (NADH) small subunit
VSERSEQTIEPRTTDSITTWLDVCPTSALTPNRGVAALFGDRQVAVFLLDPWYELLAIDNVDPFSGAAVLSRGIVGSVGGAPTVASPVYKQRFDLRTGVCMEDAAVVIATYPVRIRHGRVQVAADG